MSKQVKASHILVKTEEEIKDVKERLAKGDEFAEIAKEVSLCPSGKQGGDLGYFPEGVMVKEFNDACFSMEKGEVSEPIKTNFGWHLIHLTDILE